MEIMLDRKMKAEEKFEAISTIPGVRDFSPEDRVSSNLEFLDNSANSRSRSRSF